MQIFWGESDPLFTREDEEKLLAALENAPVEFYAIPNGSHSFFMDSWENVQMLSNAVATHARAAQRPQS